MASPLDLPTEVFTQIFSLIPRHQLIPCALVSRSWHAQAVSILYREIDLTWSRPFMKCRGISTVVNSTPCLCEQVGACRSEQHEVWQGRRHIRHMSRCLVHIPCPNEKWPAFFSLIKALVSSPSLARSVRHLRLAGLVPRSIWTDPGHTSLSNEEFHLIRSVLPRESAISRAGWLRRLDNGCPHAFAALLLVCLPNLRSIDLGPQFQDSLQMLGPGLLTSILQHLDVAAVGVASEKAWMGGGRGPFRQADRFPQLLLLHLVGVRSLYLNLPQPCIPHDWSIIACGAPTTCLEKLELAFTCLNEHDLAHLLQVCPNLRDFKYDYWTTSPLLDNAETHHDPYTPDRQSERLVETQVLQSSLNIVHKSLVTLHIHLVPPTDRTNQNLRSIDFSRYKSLTELHAPLQLLVSKDSPRSLADSLPRSLQRLWLNDDANRLWLNHDYLMDTYNYDIIETIPVTDRSWHPTYTDREVVDIISHFLSDWRAHVPDLQVLRLLMGHEHTDCRRPRNIHYIRRSLEPAGNMADIHTTVTQVQINDRYGGVGYGQDPPYFSEERIKERPCYNCDRLIGTWVVYDTDTDE